MARPQTLTDEQILSGVERYLSNTAGSDWTLADVGSAVGLHAATLVKRFGSKHGLTVALSRRWIDSVPTTVPDGDPLEELRAWLASMAGSGGADRGAESQGTASHDTSALTGYDGRADLALFAADLVDPVLRDLLTTGWDAQLRHTAALVEAVRSSGGFPRLPWQSEFAATVLMDATTGQRLRSAAVAARRTAQQSVATPSRDGLADSLINRDAATALALVESWT